MDMALAAPAKPEAKERRPKSQISHKGTLNKFDVMNFFVFFFFFLASAKSIT